MKYTKGYWRYKMAEKLAKRIADEPTPQQVYDAKKLVWRLCRLATDNERNCERDNDPAWMQNPRLAAKQERVEERWIEREKEISGLFAAYRCTVEWPGIYPSIRADEGYDIDIWEMW